MDYAVFTLTNAVDFIIPVLECHQENYRKKNRQIIMLRENIVAQLVQCLICVLDSPGFDSRPKYEPFSPLSEPLDRQCGRFTRGKSGFRLQVKPSPPHLFPDLGTSDKAPEFPCKLLLHSQRQLARNQQLSFLDFITQGVATRIVLRQGPGG